jgi:hypothetical protein
MPANLIAVKNPYIDKSAYPEFTKFIAAILIAVAAGRQNDRCASRQKLAGHVGLGSNSAAAVTGRGGRALTTCSQANASLTECRKFRVMGFSAS